MEEPTVFGQWLRQRRRSLDLTQEALAVHAGCSVASIRKFESGERRPSRQIAELMTTPLGIASDEQSYFLLFARTDRGALIFRHPALANGSAIVAPAGDDILIDDVRPNVEVSDWIEIHNETAPLPLKHKPQACVLSSAPTVPGTSEILGDGRILCKLQTAGQISGDLNGLIKQDITQMCFRLNGINEALSMNSIFFNIETTEGVIRGFYSGSFYADGDTATLRQHGRVVSVTQAYADLFDAEVFYKGEVPLVERDGSKEGFRDRATLTITPR